MYRIFFLIAFLVTPIYLVITRVIASIIYVTTHIVKKIHKWAKPYMFLLFSPCYHLCYLVLLSLRHALHSIMCCGGCAQRRARRKATITERQHQREGEEGEATSPTATATATATAKKRKSRTHAHAHRQETQDMSASLRIRPYAPPMTNSTLPSSFSSPSELSTLAARETDIPSPIPFSAPQPPSVQLAQSASLSSLSGMAASVPSSAPSTLLAPELSSWGLPEPHTFSFVNRDGIVIVYHVLGNPEAKSTIMLANGLGGKTFMLLVPLIHHFGWTDWKYVTWQYRGLFDNDATDGSIRIRKISVREHSDDCKEVMQKMGLSTVDIMIGWSMGVQVVLEFAVSYPDAVQHLILMNGSHGQVFETVFQPLFRVPGCPYLFRSAIAFLKDHPSLLFYLVSLLWRGQKLFHKVWLSIYCYLFEDRYLRQLMDRCHYQHIHPREEKKEQRRSADDLHTTQCPHHSFLFEFLETFVLDIVTNPYQYLCMFSELHTHSVYHRLSELSHPVLIIGGGLDLLSPVYQCWEMSHALQHARCCVYMDSGHVTLLEKSKKAVADIVSWLGDASLDRHPNRDPHAQHMAKTAALKQTIMRESSQMSLHTLTQRSIVMNTGQA